MSHFKFYKQDKLTFQKDNIHANFMNKWTNDNINVRL